MAPVRKPDQTGADPMQRKQVALLRRLHGNEVHRRTLHSLGDGFGIAVVVLVAFDEGLHILRRHEPRIVTQRIQPTRNMMCTRAGFHADHALRCVRQSLEQLTARDFGAHDKLAALVLAYQMKRRLADIDTDDRTGALG